MFPGMKLRTSLLVGALLVVPAVPAVAAVTTTTTTPAPVVVARYTFDGGAPTGRVADTSGRGAPLKIRATAGGTVRFVTSAAGGRYVGFPAACAAQATSCPRALLEGVDDADLDPGTRRFRWGATVYVQKSQVLDSSNVMQKGTSGTASQWKLQLGARLGKAQCVIIGQGSSTAYIARSAQSVADAHWHRVLCQRSGSTLTVFVDGAVAGHVTLPATLSIANAMPLRIGGPNFNSASDMYHGFLDDVYATLG
jgi:Concanavalin A-like lectin/glucanases superfamily